MSTVIPLHPEVRDLPEAACRELDAAGVLDIYIAGPMTGLPEFNYPAFHAAARLLGGYGFAVTNPATLFEGQLGLPWEQYMRGGLAALLECDAVYVLRGYQRSRGAQLEIQIAQALKMPVIYEAFDVAAN